MAPMAMSPVAARPVDAGEPHNEGIVQVQRGDLSLEISKAEVIRFCFTSFRTPPAQALFVQLFQDRADGTVLMNGRKYLGNTPTLVAGLNSKMRFAVVGMGSATHTFHIHGHRWVIPGAQGTAQNANNAIPNPLTGIVSQFEDTRVFGPANSFIFTIQEGSTFMRAEPGLGEWHMHCHVLGHMMMGMMGSLLVINGGELFLGLPSGQPCPPDVVGGMAMVTIGDNFFAPRTLPITVGTTVRWAYTGTSAHTTTSNPGPSNCTPASSEMWDSGVLNGGQTFDHTFNTAGSFPYHCEVHGCTMSGTIVVS
jgi:plastocyanin